MTRGEPLPVHAWPALGDKALADLHALHATTILGLTLPDTLSRPLARECVRVAVRQALAACLEQPVAAIELLARPGYPLTLAAPPIPISLSISHAPGLSVAAIHRGGDIGIDLMRVSADEGSLPDWARVAQDYLGPPARHRLAEAQPSRRAYLFAQEWTQLEAGLKCLGLALTEWTPALAQRLASCRVVALALPDNYCGAVATRVTDSA